MDNYKTIGFEWEGWSASHWGFPYFFCKKRPRGCIRGSWKRVTVIVIDPPVKYDPTIWKCVFINREPTFVRRTENELTKGMTDGYIPNTKVDISTVKLIFEGDSNG